MDRKLSLFVILTVILFSCFSSKSNLITEQEIETMPLIETHCHVDMGWDHLIALQDQENLTYALELSKDWGTLISKIKDRKDKSGAMLWVVPTEEDYLSKLENFLKSNQAYIKGIKLHPGSDEYQINKENLLDIFKIANTYDLIIASHTDSKSPAGAFIPLMEAYPKTKLILYHCFPPEEAFEVVNAYPNVFIDVSYTAWGKELQQMALAKIGKEKIVYGIDSPLGFQKEGERWLPHYRDAAKEVAAFYDFNRDVVEHVLYKNAKKLLNL